MPETQGLLAIRKGMVISMKDDKFCNTAEDGQVQDRVNSLKRVIAELPITKDEYDIIINDNNAQAADTDEKLQAVIEESMIQMQMEVPDHITEAEIQNDRQNKILSEKNSPSYLWCSRLISTSEQYSQINQPMKRLAAHNRIWFRNNNQHAVESDYVENEMITGLIRAYLPMRSRLKTGEINCERRLYTGQEGIRLYTEEILCSRDMSGLEETMTEILCHSQKKENNIAYVQRTGLADAIGQLVHTKARRKL
jgi:hypothetical protein